jgi:hypothetical protein
MPTAVNLRQRLSTGAALVLALALAGCASASSTAPRPTPASPQTAGYSGTASLGCAWYTPLAQPGQVVNVTATGEVCTDQSLIGWLAADTDRPWTSEGVIPGSFGTLLAQLARNGSVVRIWFTGPAPSATTTGTPPERTQTAPPAAVLAGRIADALQAAGWKPEA